MILSTAKVYPAVGGKKWFRNTSKSKLTTWTINFEAFVRLWLSDCLDLLIHDPRPLHKTSNWVVSHACMLSSLQVARKKLQFVQHIQNVSALLEACNRGTGSKNFSCVLCCQNICSNLKFSYMDKIVGWLIKFEYKQKTLVDQRLQLASRTCR